MMEKARRNEVGGAFIPRLSYMRVQVAAERLSLCSVFVLRDKLRIAA